MTRAMCIDERQAGSNGGEGSTLSHLVHSLSQLLTRLVGHTMMARLASGLPPSASCPLRRRVHISEMACRVLPSPMSSARIAPARQHEEECKHLALQCLAPPHVGRDQACACSAGGQLPLC